MAAIFNWCEDNGNATGIPPVGLVRNQISNPPVDASWKSIDNATTNSTGTPYSEAPVSAGTCSYTKYQYGQFSGVYNQILNCLWSPHTSPETPLPLGVTLFATVTSKYNTPIQTPDPVVTTNVTTVLPITQGLPVMLSQPGPQASNATPTLGPGGGFTQYLVTQLQTLPTAPPGDIQTITMIVQFDEN